MPCPYHLRRDAKFRVSTPPAAATPTRAMSHPAHLRFSCHSPRYVHRNTRAGMNSPRYSAAPDESGFPAAHRRHVQPDDVSPSRIHPAPFHSPAIHRRAGPAAPPARNRRGDRPVAPTPVAAANPIHPIPRIRWSHAVGVGAVGRDGLLRRYCLAGRFPASGLPETAGRSLASTPALVSTGPYTLLSSSLSRTAPHVVA